MSNQVDCNERLLFFQNHLQIYKPINMISNRMLRLYCKEDISLIKNYELAINDDTQIWECHHILETELNVSPKYLKENDLYYNRPASELIFLTNKDHLAIHKHRLGKKHSEESKEKNRIAHLNKIPWNKGMTKEEMKKYKLNKKAA